MEATTRRTALAACALFAATIAPHPVLAQGVDAALEATSADARAAANAAPADLAGLTKEGIKWVSASKFIPISPNAPPLAYETLNFFHSPGSSTPARYIAQVDGVPNGAAITAVSCIYRDESAVNEVTFGLNKATQSWAQGQSTGGSRSNASLASFASSGTPGVAFQSVDLVTPETVRTIQSFSPPTLVQLNLIAQIADDTSFAGCSLTYNMQLSPPPPNASFFDVPANHPFFQVIEALRASGITTGCTATEFCPDLPVTRAAMAAFLARALGLFFPY